MECLFLFRKILKFGFDLGRATVSLKLSPRYYIYRYIGDENSAVYNSARSVD